MASIISNIEQKFPKVMKKHFTCDKIAQKAHLNMPNEYKHKYIDILYKHQAAINVNKMDLGQDKKIYTQNPSERQ